MLAMMQGMACLQVVVSKWMVQALAVQLLNVVVVPAAAEVVVLAVQGVEDLAVQGAVELPHIVELLHAVA
jgi:hypothetical protein